jgi:serine/threonine-protein kinase
MALNIGTKLGSHEITALLGKGGMGEVYRARDLKLKREVAIKILPEEFSRDADRVSRFQREAEVLASLNHPNIAAIHDLDEDSGTRYLVLELVEGDTLADRIARSAIPVEEALTIAIQICEALEAAHEKGIIHRDLKPANVKLTPDGKVKVLDFGLAKALDGTPANGTLSNSPTMLSGTMGGMILGTAAYMSPEQAKGRSADKRSDVWAFGCMLYEMLAGKSAFEGEDVSDTLAAVLRAEPDWSALPANLPTSIVSLIKRCLERDMRRRVGDIAVVRFVLDEPAPSQNATPIDAERKQSSTLRRAIGVVALLVMGAALASGAWWMLRPAPARPVVTRFTMALPDGQRLTSLGRQVLALSPGGIQLVYSANQRLYLRSLSELQPREIPGTASSVFVAFPAFSPDGHSVAFAYSSPSGIEIRKIDINGGAAVPVCQLDAGTLNNGLLGMSWSSNGILFGHPDKGIMRVSENGGQPEILIPLKPGEAAHGPQMLPDGRTLLFTYVAGGVIADRWDRAQIVVQSLQTGERKTIVQIGSDGRYVPTGHIVYAVSGVLYAVPFDAKRLQTTGSPVRVVEGVVRGLGPFAGAQAVYTVSDGGSLAYIPGPASISTAQHEVTVLDRDGAASALKLPPGPYEYPRVSPDGNKIAIGSDNGTEAIVWVYDLSQTSTPLKLTFGARNRFPIWSHDSKRVSFQSDREGDGGIFQQLADGTSSVERVTKADQGTTHIPNSWSPDGHVLLFDVAKDAYSLWMWSTVDKKMVQFPGVEPSFAPTTAVFSPDGHWVAYSTREKGRSRNTLYVQPFPPTGAKYQVNREDDGHHPVWSRDGKRLFYNPALRLVAVNVTTQPSFSSGLPENVPGSELIQAGPTSPRSYDITPTGTFIGVGSSRQVSFPGNVQQINIVVNWFEELKQRVPVR